MEQPARQHKENQQDAEGGKDEDFQELQAAARQRVNSQKVVVPTPSRKNMKEIDVRKLTRSQKNMVLEQVLQVEGISHAWHFMICKVSSFVHCMLPLLSLL